MSVSAPNLAAGNNQLRAASAAAGGGGMASTAGSASNDPIQSLLETFVTLTRARNNTNLADLATSSPSTDFVTSLVRAALRSSSDFDSVAAAIAGGVGGGGGGENQPPTSAQSVPALSGGNKQAGSNVDNAMASALKAEALQHSFATAMGLVANSSDSEQDFLMDASAQSAAARQVLAELEEDEYLEDDGDEGDDDENEDDDYPPMPVDELLDYNRRKAWDDDFVLKRQFSALLPAFDPRPGRTNVNQMQDVELPSPPTSQDGAETAAAEAARAFERETSVKSLVGDYTNLKLRLRGPNIPNVKDTEIELADDDKTIFHYVQLIVQNTDFGSRVDKSRRIWEPTYIVIYEEQDSPMDYEPTMTPVAVDGAKVISDGDTPTELCQQTTPATLGCSLKVREGRLHLGSDGYKFGWAAG